MRKKQNTTKFAKDRVIEFKSRHNKDRTKEKMKEENGRYVKIIQIQAYLHLQCYNRIMLKIGKLDGSSRSQRRYSR